MELLYSREAWVVKVVSFEGVPLIYMVIFLWYHGRMDIGKFVVIQNTIFLMIDLVVYYQVCHKKNQSMSQRCFKNLVFFSVALELVFIANKLSSLNSSGALVWTKYIYYTLTLFCLSSFAYNSLRYIYRIIPDNKEPSRLVSRLFALPVAIITFLSAVSYWTHWVLYIDSDLAYHYGKASFFYFIALGFYPAISLFFIVRELIKGNFRKLLKPMKYLFFLIIPMYTGAVLNNKYHNSGYIHIATGVGMLFLYLSIYTEESKKIERLKALAELNGNLEKELKIVESLSESFVNIYLVNRVTRQVEVVKMDGYIPLGFEKIGQCYPYEEIRDAFLEKRVYRKDVDAVRNYLDWDNMMKGVTENDSYDCSYRVKTETGFHYYQVKCKKLESSKYIICGFQNVDELVLDEKERNYSLNKALENEKFQNKIVNTLCKDFIYVYLIDPKNDSSIPIKEGEKIIGIKDVEKINGHSYYQNLSSMVKMFVHKEDRERLLENLKPENLARELSDKEEYSQVYRVIDELGIRYYQVKYIRMKDSDWIIEGFQNIDLIMKEEQKKKEALETALASAEYANRAKTVFLNNMSHDIRTPMNAIIGFTSLAGSHIDDKELVRDYLGKISTSGKHLLSLINDILDMSRIESGKVNIEEADVNVLELVEEIKTITQASITEKKHNLVIDTQDIVNKNVITDKLRLNQIIINILSNAIKFTKEGGSIYFTVRERPCYISGYADFDFVIRDTGIGMKPEFLIHIFEAFTRERTSTVSGIQGTGLGMAITKTIVDMLGGTITVHSKEGQGTEFAVNLQFKISSNSENKEIQDSGLTDEDKESLSKKFFGKTILLAEDNLLNQEIAKAILEENGFIVDIANDGTEAVGKMEKAAQGKYDLILMDVQMPEMDGYEATKKIRLLEDKSKASVPIIAMTANVFEEDKQNAIKAGMNGHLAKPIDVNELLKVLASIL